MKKVIAILSLLGALPAVASERSFTCDYSYFSRSLVLRFDGETVTSQTLVSRRDPDCGDLTRTLAAVGQRDGSVILTLSEQGGIGGMDCEKVDREIFKLRVDASTTETVLEGDALGTLRCSWN